MKYNRNQLEMIGFALMGLGLFVWGCAQFEFVVNVFVPENASEPKRADFEATLLKVATAPLCVVGLLVYKIGQKRNRSDLVFKE